MKLPTESLFKRWKFKYAGLVISKIASLLVPNKVTKPYRGIFGLFNPIAIQLEPEGIAALSCKSKVAPSPIFTV